MSMQIALLRGINVGGHKAVAMAALRELVSGLGFGGVKTLLQSGNLVFESEGRTSGVLEALLEKETAAKFGATVDYVVRDAAAWARVVAANPFPREAKTDPSHLVVMFLKAPAAAKQVKAVEAAIKGPEMLKGRGKELYIVYPAGIGTSKLTGAVIEKTLGIRGTARNWNTVLKLLALAGDAGPAGRDA